MISLHFAPDLGWAGMATARGHRITVEEASPHSADGVQALFAVEARFAVGRSGTAC
jgi:hypothetical protein